MAHVSSGPQRLPDWNPSAGGIEACYFRDPDGHPLETLHFPPGKGAEKSHAASDKLFLGIDHTAIVVSDTERSLRFHRDRLGLRVAGESENCGPEQERLNAVFGAPLRIAALRAAAGPGVEFLQYLAPSDGREAPPDLRDRPQLVAEDARDRGARAARPAPADDVGAARLAGRRDARRRPARLRARRPRARPRRPRAAPRRAMRARARRVSRWKGRE